MDLADENISLSSPVKRGREEEDRCDGNKRSRGDEVKGLQVDIKDLCKKAMIKIIEKSEKVAERTLLISENMVRAMTENTCVLAKLVDSMSSLRNTIQEFDREEKRREKRRDLELKREEEWRKALNRLRDEERR